MSSKENMLGVIHARVTDSNVCYVVSTILLVVASLQIVNDSKIITANGLYMMILSIALLCLSTLCSIIISFKTDYIFKTKTLDIPDVKIINTIDTTQKYNTVMLSTLFIPMILTVCYYIIR